ncbi:hypothetical protein Cenrod_0385 [Candidatus Symbiobacter mobilis CR]|uniref:Uncharacterized protein n=1 Tax=Candidatus Symbiobacter mobilis CR TaxID=946483 RepID=U5N8B7_9BURK|nr:hypothetical protein Cenrod_0385 [Candidatus Symbiobacter mobilis CR]
MRCDRLDRNSGLGRSQGRIALAAACTASASQLHEDLHPSGSNLAYAMACLPWWAGFTSAGFTSFSLQKSVLRNALE